jgi:hypothetical protein
MNKSLIDSNIEVQFHCINVGFLLFSSIGSLHMFDKLNTFERDNDKNNDIKYNEFNSLEQQHLSTSNVGNSWQSQSQSQSQSSSCSTSNCQLQSNQIHEQTSKLMKNIDLVLSLQEQQNSKLLSI